MARTALTKEQKAEQEAAITQQLEDLKSTTIADLADDKLLTSFIKKSKGTDPKEILSVLISAVTTGDIEIGFKKVPTIKLK